MESSIVIVLLLVIILMAAFGFYLIYTTPLKNTGGLDPGVRIVGTEGSIVSVRKIADEGGYEVKVDSLPPADLYDDGEFLYHQESPMERWLRNDISEEERRLLYEELKTRYGIDMGWKEDVQEGAASDERTDETVETEVDPETLMPVARANRFEGYDPFSEDASGAVSEVDERQVVTLLKFIIDSYLKGLLRPEVLVTASERYGTSVPLDDVDLERIRRQQDLTGVMVDQELLKMTFEDFDMYVHDAVASAAVSEVMPSEEVPEVSDATEENTAEDIESDAAVTADASFPEPYDWRDMEED